MIFVNALRFLKPGNEKSDDDRRDYLFWTCVCDCFVCICFTCVEKNELRMKIVFVVCDFFRPDITEMVKWPLKRPALSLSLSLSPSLMPTPWLTRTHSLSLTRTPHRVHFPICTLLRVYIHTNRHACKNTRMHVHARTHTQVQKHAYVSAHTRVLAHTHSRIHTKQLFSVIVLVVVNTCLVQSL